MDRSSHSTSCTLPLHYEHQLHFSQSVFALENSLLADLIAAGSDGRIAEVVVFYDNSLVAEHPLWAAEIAGYFQNFPAVMQLAASPTPVPGGEQGKNDWQCLESLWRTIHDAGLCRHSFIVVVGGGAVLDLVGFAASTAHRGIPLIRIPTTALSQGDGGVGVKNAVNYFGKKNWLGAFTVPYAVINDGDFLHRLPDCEKRNGLVEAVKVALIRDRSLFEYIESRAQALAQFEKEPFEEVIRRSALRHLDHIASGGDPFEQGSSRPLDFGHWAAHKLEPLSGFALSHGEAVSIGMALDLSYAQHRDLLSEQDLSRIMKVFTVLEFSWFSPWLEAKNAAGRSELWTGLEEFREHLGGDLTIPMVTGIGACVDVHAMCPETIASAIHELKQRGGD